MTPIEATALLNALGVVPGTKPARQLHLYCEMQGYGVTTSSRTGELLVYVKGTNIIVTRVPALKPKEQPIPQTPTAKTIAALKADGFDRHIVFALLRSTSQE